MVQTNSHNIRCNESERGVAIVLVLVVLMTLTMLSVGVLTSSITNNALSRNYERNTQAINMSEIGVKVAYREFINSGFLRTTHTMNGETPVMGDDLLQTSLSDFYIDENGDFVWEWDTGKSYDPMWNTEKPHGFKFSVYATSSFAFIIECDGWYGTIRKRTRARGEIENMFQFSYFATRDLGDLAFENDHIINGRIHSNGNIYIRPVNGSLLRLDSSSVTAVGHIIRSRDAWGQPDDNGTCEITESEEGSGTWVEMVPGIPRGSEGIAFDSFNSNWNDRTFGARAKWGGVVRDRVPYKSPPPIQILDSGGYYDQLAGLHINDTTHINAWCNQVVFWNWNEQRWETVEDINVGDMVAGGDWPANGVIYCDTPTRLSNATSLPANLMYVSNSNIYTMGNFNTVAIKGVALMTKHRIYHLSSVWDDAQSANSINMPAVTTTINAALVDGAPTVDEYNWVDLDGDNIYDWSGITIYNPVTPKTAIGYTDPNSSIDPKANTLNLLEQWTGETITIQGSIIHLGGAEMCPNLDNAGLIPTQLAWVLRTGYREPTAFVFQYDPNLVDPAGQPPYTPLIGHITSWAPF